MNDDAAGPARFPAARLEEFIARAFAATGMPGDDAETIAGLMVEADLAGLDGHGIFRLPQYIKRIGDGGMNILPDIRLERDRGAIAVVDGDNGAGHLVAKFAAQAAISKAREFGIGWVGIHSGNHAGPARLYPKMAMNEGMIGIYSAVGSANHLPPWGGTEMLLSTNPISIAIPAGEAPPIILDMATTVSSYGNIKTAAQRGETMPEGWMIDRQGKPLTDPKRAGEGFLLPIGGAKGYGLALVFGILAGTLNGAALGSEVVDFNADSVTPTNTGQFICALAIDAFTEIEEFKRATDRVIAEIKASPLLPGFDEVRLPGEASQRIEAERREHGIPMHEATVAVLDTLGAELGIGKFN